MPLYNVHPLFIISVISPIHTAVCPPSSSKKPTHRPWVILHEPFQAKFDPPITQNLFYLRI
ncbi:hypothetical protein SFRURICE_006912 [Spodoptera frugiperda]|nr:hypothetical protein SFRURICE_006912 [Spodoptera frugiperda]